MKSINFILLLSFISKTLFAGGAGTSAQDNYFYLIPLVILVVLWVWPGAYSYLKSKLIGFLKTIFKHHPSPASDPQ